MEKITKSLLALMLMLVGLVSAKAGDAPVPPKAPDAPAAPKASALVTDGSVQQYLYNVGAKGFFIGANDWGTRASISTEKGYWVKMTANGETFTLTNEAKGGNAADCQGVDQIWVDGAGRAGDGKWTVTIAEDNSFKLGNTNVAGFLSVLPSKNDTKLYMSEADEAQNVWIAVSEADYAAYQEAIPAYQEAVKKYNEDYAQYQKDYAAWLKENYKAGEDISALAPADWTGQGGNYGGLANPAKEKYVDGANAPLKAGEVMTQTIDGLKNGKYIVLLEAAGSYTSGRGFECPTGDGLAVAFANDQEENLPIVDRGWVGEGEQNFYALETEVTDGTLKYGVKNLADAGNWYVIRLASIAMIPEKETWFTDNLFCYKDAKASPKVDRSTDVAWTADPKDVTNGCIKVVAPANADNDHDCQFWIRGAEIVNDADLSKGAFAKGTGFKVTFKVKADGEYEVLPGYYRSKEGSTAALNDKNAWNHISYFADKLKVTKEWQTVSYVCMSPDDLFTSFGLNLADNTDKKARTFYFDDVKIEGRGGSEWYLNNEFHAKDYKDPTAKYSDGQDPHPAARFVSDAEGGYVEVISNAGGDQTYNSQLWIAIPAEFVGTSTKMTMEVQASKAITVPENFQATATGNGWGCNPAPGKGLTFTVGEWTTVDRILNTKDMKSTGTWKDLQADQYCLDLTEKLDGNAGEAITYKFRNVKFEQAAEDWYGDEPTIFAKDFTKGTETYTNGNPIPKAPYVYGNGAEGGYIQVVSNASAANDYDSQIFFEIPEELRGKSVQISMKAKASKEISVAAQLHSTADGNGWGPAPAGDAVAFTVGEWTEIKRTFDSNATDQNGNPVAYYVLNLSEKGGDAITYNIDEVSFQEFIDWGELEEAPVEGTLVATQDWTTATSYSGWNILNDATKVTLSKGEGLVIENTALLDQAYSSQFFVADGWTFDAGKQYVVRYTAKIKGEGSIRTDVNHWGDAVADEGVPYTDGYKQILFTYGVSSVSTGGWHVIFQPGKFIGKIILEKVELFDVTPKYDEMDWSDNIVPNGDLATDDMSAFILKNNDVEDPEMLPAEKTAIGDAFEIDIETAARPTNEDGSVGGNDHDAQFFVRLPYVLPKGTLFNLEFDLYAEEINTLTIAAHAEPGQWKANMSSVTTDTQGEGIVHYQKYLSAPADMRTIAFNLAVATDATYGFSNFKVQFVNDDKAAIEAATATADGTTLWAETLAANEAAHEGRSYSNEDGQYTEESFQALTDAIAAAKAEIKKAEQASEEVTAESLTAATKAVTDAIAALESDAPLADTDLTKEMFFTWTAVDATAEKTTQAGCDYNVGTSTGMPYGDGTVNEYNYADLSAYDHLAITATEGEPRLLFNRAAQDDHQGPLSVELPRDKGQNKYEAVVDNGDGSKTYVINLKAIVEKDGYAHLHAIKGANWANTTVTEMKLFVGESEYTDVLTGIADVETAGAAKDGKYFINGQIVIVKGGKKFNAAGVEIK